MFARAQYWIISRAGRLYSTSDFFNTHFNITSHLLSSPRCLRFKIKSKQSTLTLSTNSRSCIHVLIMLLLVLETGVSLSDMICLYEHTLAVINIQDKKLDECVAIKSVFGHFLGLPRDLWSSSLLTETVYRVLVSGIRAACPAHFIFLDLIPNNICFLIAVSFLFSNILLVLKFPVKGQTLLS
jgi:hypothetical protein